MLCVRIAKNLQKKTISNASKGLGKSIMCLKTLKLKKYSPQKSLNKKLRINLNLMEKNVVKSECFFVTKPGHMNQRDMYKIRCIQLVLYSVC